MITAIEAIAIKSTLGLLGVWFFVFCFWRDYRLDALREDVFKLRDELFQFAASGAVGFETDAYKILRARMNAILRYAHLLTMTRLMVYVLRPHPAKGGDLILWERSLELIPSVQAQQKLNEVNYSLVVAILRHLIFRSLVLYFLTRPILGYVELRDLVTKRVFSKKVVRGIEQLESEAFDEEYRRKERQEAVAVGAG